MTPTPVPTQILVPVGQCYEAVAASPDPFVVLAMFAVIAVPALLWARNEFRTWRAGREGRRAVGKAVAGEAGRHSG